MTTAAQRLEHKMQNKEYRDNFVAAQVRRSFAAQIRDLRGNQTQKEFADKIGKPASVVSRIEDPYSHLSVRTCISVAQALGMGLRLELIPLDEVIASATREVV